MPNEAISIQTAHDALQELEDALSKAYGQARSQELRDLLDARLDAIEKLLTALDRADISSRTIALSAAADSTVEALKRLSELKARIQTIANNISKAAQVLDGVDKVLSGVKEYFGI
jgi:predicted DNA-binding protein